MANPDRNEFDTIVVGSGPSGATVARDLSLADQRVLLLEAGSAAPVGGSFTGQMRATRMNFVGNGVPVVKGCTLGGTSMLYYATAFEPPLAMFRAHGVDLSTEIEDVRRELPICKLPDSAIGPRAKRIMSSARDLGFAWEKLDKFVFADRCATGVPYEARWNARLPIQDAVDNGAVVKTGARVERVLFDRDTAVGVRFNEGGSEKTAHAGTIVLSAGGVGSAAILAASGIRGAGNGFFCDPIVTVNGTVDDISGPAETPMAAGMHFAEDGYVMTDLTGTWPMYCAFTALALRFDRLLAFPGTLSIMVKARDELAGEINADGKVRRTFSAADLAKLAHGAARAEAILAKAGAKHIFRFGMSAAHPGGSARIGDVVDANLKTAYDNLYVCDCSVIPEAWGLPPTFALLALGRRLSKHLLGRSTVETEDQEMPRAAAM